MIRPMPRLIAVILFAFALAGSPLARGGLWGDTWGDFIWGLRTLVIPVGFNLYAPTSELPDMATSCFDLLSFLGGPASVETIVAVVTATQQTSECSYQDAAPRGDDFPIVLGAAYVVKMAEPRELASGPPPSCPATTLGSGVNLVGVGQPPVSLACFDIIAAFGTGVVSTVERLNKTSNKFEACAFTVAATVTGTNFRILAGEGYIVHATSASGPVNLNDLTHPVCE